MNPELRHTATHLTRRERTRCLCVRLSNGRSVPLWYSLWRNTSSRDIIDAYVTARNTRPAYVPGIDWSDHYAPPTTRLAYDPTVDDLAPPGTYVAGSFTGIPGTSYPQLVAQQFERGRQDPAVPLQPVPWDDLGVGDYGHNVQAFEEEDIN